MNLPGHTVFEKLFFLLFIQGQTFSLNMPVISVGGTLQTFTD